jgi:hypothetical protein
MWWRRTSGREKTHDGDRREQPSAEAKDTESVSEDMLFFQELIQPPESI